MANYDRGDAIKALSGRFYNNLPTGVTSKDVYWLNSKYTTPNDKLWLRENFTLLNTTQDPCRWKRDEMYYTIDIFAPDGTGVSRANDIAKEVRQLFENQVFDNVKCLNAEIEDLGVDKPWYQLQVNVNFYYEGL